MIFIISIKKLQNQEKLSRIIIYKISKKLDTYYLCSK